jgi:hypothetical protein
MRRGWLYFASRSERLNEPVLIWPQFVATAMSAMVTFSLLPILQSSKVLMPYKNRIEIATPLLA